MCSRIRSWAEEFSWDMLVTPGISALEDIISAFALLIHTNFLLTKYLKLTIDLFETIQLPCHTPGFC
jgi:hypothetical protein